jgi:hypothetical protein
MEEENFPRGGVVKRKGHHDIKKNSEDKDLFQVQCTQCLKWTVAQSPNVTNILFRRPKAAPN